MKKLEMKKEIQDNRFQNISRKCQEKATRDYLANCVSEEYGIDVKPFELFDEHGAGLVGYQFREKKFGGLIRGKRIFSFLGASQFNDGELVVGDKRTFQVLEEALENVWISENIKPLYRPGSISLRDPSYN